MSGKCQILQNITKNIDKKQTFSLVKKKGVYVKALAIIWNNEYYYAKVASSFRGGMKTTS